jgi:glycosyltransferase involved in cell wall biosynthesis
MANDNCRFEKEPLVSACIIAKNEEENLAGCLESGRDFWDEVVLVDTGSTDKTVEIAKAFGARVLHEPWQDDFSQPRNTALEAARGVFCHMIDCDERIVDTDLAETRHHLANDALPSLLLVREQIRYPGGRQFTMIVPRIVKRSSGIRYLYPVHEQLDVKDETGLLTNIRVTHHGYESDENLTRKETRNLRIAKSMPENHPHGLHCRARSAMALELWHEVESAAATLVETEPSLLVAIEGCVLGGVANYQLRQLSKLEFYLRRGKEIAPDNPDILFLEFLTVGTKYAASFPAGDSFAPGDFMRPWLLWHDQRQIELLLEVLAGKRRLLDEGESQRQFLPGSASADSQMSKLLTYKEEREL